MTREKTFIITIAGPSCAGKTETAKAVARLLGARILSLDSYYLNLDHLSLAQRKQFNFDEPSALDHHLLIQHLRDLGAGNLIEAPIYDFVQYTRAGQTEVIEPAPFLILEGLFVLYWADVRALSNLTVYVDAPDEICLERRLYRDVRERGRTEESVLKQYRETVRPMAAKYVGPTRELADLVVSGTDRLDHCTTQVLDHISARLGRPATELLATK